MRDSAGPPTALQDRRYSPLPGNPQTGLCASPKGTRGVAPGWAVYAACGTAPGVSAPTGENRTIRGSLIHGIRLAILLLQTGSINQLAHCAIAGEDRADKAVVLEHRIDRT